MSVLKKLVCLNFCFALLSCKKDKVVYPPGGFPVLTSPSVSFSFKAKANNKDLIVNTKWNGNAANDSFTVTKFNYYISNINFIKSNGGSFVEPQSYHLIKHVEGQTSFKIDSIAAGTYTAIEFLIGVDSLRNISGAQTGALDVANNMFWDWNSGYIFFKLEGKYLSGLVSTAQEYAVHIGGFTGKYSCLQKVKLVLSSPLLAQSGKQSKIFLNTIVDEIFMNPNTIGFDDYYASVTLPMFQSISLNYKDMFVVDKVEN